MEQLKVSIVMPVFNGEKYLEEAILSIIKQDFTEWEFIIVIECGSSQASIDICDKYAQKDTRIVLIKNTERLRIAESLNVGIRHAKGEYIVRMDADDISMPERISALVRYMDNHKNIDICGTKVKMIGETTWDWKVETEPKILKCASLFSTPFVHPTVIMRKKSLEKYSLEYNKEFLYTEDFEFFENSSHFLNFANIDYDGYYTYRFYQDNATSIGGEQGIRNEMLVVKKAMLRYGVELTEDELTLLTYASYPVDSSPIDAKDHLTQLDIILKRILLCDKIRNEFGIDILFNVLHRRWKAAYEKNKYNDAVNYDESFKALYKRGLFHYDSWPISKIKSNADVPTITVLVPTYNSESYILDTINSVIRQDYQNFEILVVNEFGSKDNTVKSINLFEDPRIRIIQNEKKLGLAESLNKGLREARGEYIARVDADDIYPTNRFSRQLEYMTAHPDVSVCGSYQRYFGKDDRVHMPPCKPEEMKASLLFKCDVCHSTVMLKKKDFIDNDLFYDSNYLSEDYELWTRAAQKLKFATIPEILGEYRWDGNNITQAKMDRLDKEAQAIVARSLKNNLNIDISNAELVLLSGWENPFWGDDKYADHLRNKEKELLLRILEQNSNLNAYEEGPLRKVIDERMLWAGIISEDNNKNQDIMTSGEDNGENKEFVTNEDADNTHQHTELVKPLPTDSLIKRIVKKPLRPFYRIIRRHLEDRLIILENESHDQNAELVRVNDRLASINDLIEDNQSRLEHFINSAIDQKIKGILDEIKMAKTEVLDVDDRNNIRLNSLFEKQENDQASVAKSINSFNDFVTRQFEENKSFVTELNDLVSRKFDENKIYINRLNKESTNELKYGIQEEGEKQKKNIISLMDDNHSWISKCINEDTNNNNKRFDDSNNRIKELGDVLDTRVWNAETYLKSENQYVHFLVNGISALRRDEKKVILLGTPYHTNLGDHAQTYCIRKWIEENYPDYRIVEINSPSNDHVDMHPYYELLKERLTSEDRILIQSGCHLTDIFENELEVVMSALDVFKEFPIISFPQTVYFTDEKRAKEVAEKLIMNNNLFLMTRGTASDEYSKSLDIPNTYKMPDVVSMLIGTMNFNCNDSDRSGFFVCKRTEDLEHKFVMEDLEEQLIKIKSFVGDYDVEDTTIDRDYEEVKWNREYYVQRIISQIAKRKFVITDRMHGLIFSLVASTPVIVLSTSTPKVRSAARWYQDDSEFGGYVYTCDDVMCLETIVNQLLDDSERRKKLSSSFGDRYYGSLKERIETFINCK